MRLRPSCRDEIRLWCSSLPRMRSHQRCTGHTPARNEPASSATSDHIAHCSSDVAAADGLVFSAVERRIASRASLPHTRAVCDRRPWVCHVAPARGNCHPAAVSHASDAGHSSLRMHSDRCSRVHCRSQVVRVRRCQMLETLRFSAPPPPAARSCRACARFRSSRAPWRLLPAAWSR